MKTFKLFLVVAVMTSFLAIPCTTSFAENTLSASPAAAYVVKKEEVKKERGFFEKIGDALKSIVNFFTGDKPADKQTTTEQRKVVEQPTVQPAQQALVNIPEIQPGVAEAPANVAEPVDIPQVKQQVHIQQTPVPTQPSVPPLAPTAPSATHAAPAPSPVITVTQSSAVTPTVVTPQQVDRKNDILGFSKIEVETEKNIPEAVDERETAGEIKVPEATITAKQDVIIPKIAEDARETEPKIATVVQAPVIVQAPLARIPSGQVTTTAPTGTRTTTTTATTTTASGTRATTAPATTTPTRATVTTATTTGTQTTAPTEPTRITTPAQTTEPTPSAPRGTPPATTEPAPRPTTSYTETFEGQTIIGMTVAPVETFAIVDTVDIGTTNLRSYVVSPTDGAKVECPAPASAPTATTRTLTTAGTIADTAATLQQVQVISDTLKAELFAQCPTTQRLPPATAEVSTGARFITTIGNGNTLAYVIGNSFRATTAITTAGVLTSEEGSAQQNAGAGEEGTPPEGDVQQEPPPPPPPPLSPPTLDVLVTPADCQATLEARVICSENTDCTGDYVFDAIVMAGKTVLLDFVTRVNDNTFLIAPPKEPAEQIKGLSASVNKADIQGPVTITVTAKKGGDAPIEHIVEDVPNRDDLIARCVQPKTTVAGEPLKAYDETNPDQRPTGSADFVGGGCSLIRR